MRYTNIKRQTYKILQVTNTYHKDLLHGRIGHKCNFHELENILQI